MVSGSKEMWNSTLPRSRVIIFFRGMVSGVDFRGVEINPGLGLIAVQVVPPHSWWAADCVPAAPTRQTLSCMNEMAIEWKVMAANKKSPLKMTIDIGDDEALPLLHI